MIASIAFLRDDRFLLGRRLTYSKLFRFVSIIILKSSLERFLAFRHINFQIYKRELDDNLKLRDVQKETTECEKEEAEIKEKLSTINRDVLNEKNSLSVQYNKLSSEKFKTDGILNELQVIFTKTRFDVGENKANLSKIF